MYISELIKKAKEYMAVHGDVHVNIQDQNSEGPVRAAGFWPEINDPAFQPDGTSLYCFTIYGVDSD